ncbi:superoxide dismutase [Actinomadura sp. CNU-125]|uniref:SMP-30/gluconolactonase/LRE family protein n=1 Tax=Actinomadura sp. CNU-125 TaxID=1904961 RepID=UPI00095F64F1|nr:SMP-30/gluconolactonase/LRE family protein [Actinomadura sp. CNU-125]OLT30269.1 superoxide dismutase [Actinomadura sp. CNU-125]
MSRLYRSAAVAALAAIALPAAAPSAVAAPAAPHVRVTTAYELPGDRVYPEGIAADPRTGVLYAGSFGDGTVYRMSGRDRVAEVFLPAGADGRDTANGLEIDRRGRLWVTDSNTGVAVYDAGTRRLLARFDLPGDGPGFVNDLAITPDGTAYLTDSLRAVVYRVAPRDLAAARGGRADLKPYVDMGPALEPYEPGAYTLNGVVAGPHGRYLLVVDSTGGDLYRVDTASGAVAKVALHGGDMELADGLDLRHGRLWAAHNVSDAITRWRVSADGRAAWLRRRVVDAELDAPTTLVRVRGTLYVVRSQFDEGGPLGSGTPETPFTVAAVRGL